MSEREYISREDFKGKNSAIVEDVFGTRVAFRNIPRGNRVIYGAVTSVNPETLQLTTNVSQVQGLWTPEMTVNIFSAWAEAMAEAAIRGGCGTAFPNPMACPEHGFH